MLATDSMDDSATDAGMRALSTTTPTKPEEPSASEANAVADGLWHQAQTVYGAIARARTATKERVRTVALTSCYRREGVSTVAAVLGLAVSCQKKVLLIDGNLSEPSIHRRFQVSPTPGLIQAMAGQASPRECIQNSPLGVSVITAGCTAKSHSFLSAEHAYSFIDTLAEAFDLVIVDLPAMSEDSSALELSSRLDGVVFVVEAERVHRQAAQRTMSRLQKAGAQVIGAVFNKRRDYTPDWLYRVL